MTMTAKTFRFTQMFIWLGLCALLFSSVLMPATVLAQSAPTASGAGLQVEQRDGALQLQWQGGVQAASTAAFSAAKSYGGYLLPLETVMVELAADQSASSAVAATASVSSSPYTGELTLAPQIDPPALDWTPEPISTPYVEPALPTSPLFVIADGFKRDQHLAVLGFSPIFRDPNTGEVRYADSVSASIAGASVAEENDATADPATDSRYEPVAALATAAAPTNPLANTDAYKIFVSTAGMQQLSGADLAAEGLTSPQVSKLRLFFKGVQVPLHVIDSNNNNVLNPTDYIRFYAPAAGDAWNLQSVYWLTDSGADGVRMGQRNVAAAGATTRNTAYEVGTYLKNSIYESTLAGDDGDNWFQANLRAETESVGFDITIPHQLPLNNSLPTLLSLHVTPYALQYGDLVHRLQLSTPGYEYADDNTAWIVNLTGTKPFRDEIRNLSLGKAADTWKITLLKESSDRAVMFNKIAYWLPVQLNFGNKGATFEGVAGTWRYQLSGTPTDVDGGRTLYDITDPNAPQRLTIPGGASFEFQDGNTAHRYLLTGPGTMATPTVAKHEPVDLTTKGAANTLYITPAIFREALQPLVNHRKGQGLQVGVVDVQAIYDSWSFGMVDAEAIRSFLAYAVGNWKPAPMAAVLVGDTTWDPHNYSGFNNPSFIPPYIANADPWLKYVPCDSCYGQLNPPDSNGRPDYMIDIWIGRFPVIDVVEVNTVVDKIIRYENAPDVEALWRSTSVQIADDDVRPDGSVDSAGPFIGSAEKIIHFMPSAVRQLRNYFLGTDDLSAASPDLLALLNSVKPWLNDNPDEALQRSVELMNSGAGLVTYTGHGNHYQWARIVDEGNKWMFGWASVGDLRNLNTPFISLSMTCYTSQFHIPAPKHYTLDERLFLHGNGGAIATWGPTGFSIVPAHDTLQEGFHKMLWKSPPLRAKLGALTEAGYDAILASAQNYDVAKTFAFMGDPMTAARITDINTIYMPQLQGPKE